MLLLLLLLLVLSLNTSSLKTQRTFGGILLPKGPPKANSDAHYGEVGARAGLVHGCTSRCMLHCTAAAGSADL